MHESQPSLRQHSTSGWGTQDFILGYFQSSLRDLAPSLRECRFRCRHEFGRLHGRQGTALAQAFAAQRIAA